MKKPEPNPSPRSSISPARRVAFEILKRVELENSYASVLLASWIDHLNPKDRSLCYEIVLGVLRWRLWLDRVIEHFANRKSDEIDAMALIALRIGLYQLRFLTRVPASAAVNESVNLTSAAGLRSAVGFVNAVLRRATREPEFDPAATVKDTIRRLSIQTSHPEWLVARWVRAFGLECAEAFTRSNNEQPPTAFRLIGEKRDETLIELREAGAELTESTLALGAWRISGATQSLLAFAAAGRVYLQDEASQMVARLVDPRPGGRTLDLCAAPGGKTGLISELAGAEGEIVACDVHEHRLREMRDSVALRELRNVRYISIDATDPLPFEPASFDRVLVDAPCSGTGTLRRNPEIKWRLNESDITELAVKQGSILTRAAGVVKRGGRMVYSTCSVEVEEDEEVVRSFLGSNAEFVVVVPASPRSLITSEGFVRTWPHREGSDGFFAAVLERAK